MSDYSFIRPETVKFVQAERFSKFQERAIGIMLGMAVGDSVGALFKHLPFQAEGYQEGVKNPLYKLNPGQWTDGTSLGLCLADMLYIDRVLNETQLVLAFRDWWQHGYNTPFTKGAYKTSVGLGSDNVQSLQAIEKISLDDTTLSRPTNTGEQFTSGNGSLMRNGPVAIRAKEIDEARRLAFRQSKTTHQGEEAAACCELMAYILFLALHIKEEDPEEIKNSIKKKLNEFKCSVQSVNELAVSGWAQNPKGEALEKLNGVDPHFPSNPECKQSNHIGFYVMDALAMALHCVYTTASFEEALRKAAMRGGDADTVGAITGQIAGAIYGRDAIPKKWVDDVQRWDRGGEIAARGYLLTL
ncbi:MAG: ADP-ribosylglycohydrolase family protein [Chlamydiales bacterium]|nr:ADP-ribosylglycohydrolase family protein [Chlamydiales bacterium]